MDSSALNWLQWPAMVVTIVATGCVGSRDRHRRFIGFRVFLLGNVLWVAWGVPARAWGLVGLQIGLFVMNLRGLREAE